MKKSKKFISKILATLMLLTVLLIPLTKKADALSSPISCYTLYSSSNVTTYSRMDTRYRTGYIAPNDLVKITNLYSVRKNYTTQKWAKVTYPTSRGTRTAYCLANKLFINSNYSTKKGYFGVSKTVYKKPNGYSKFGTVYAFDHVTIVGRTNGYTQIIYPTNNGYKMGWVKGNYSL